MSQLIRKNWKKGLSGRLAETGLRAGGTLVAVAASKKLENIAPKVHGPALFLLGALADVFVENDQIRALGQGISSAGAIITAKTFIPEDIKATIGLNGLGSTDEAWSPGVGEIDYDSPISGAAIGELAPTDVDDYSARQLIDATMAGGGEYAMSGNINANDMF